MSKFTAFFMLSWLCTYPIVGWDSYHFMQPTNRKLPASKIGPSRHPPFDLGRYHKLEDIYLYLEELENMYPEFVRITDIGKTHEGRALKLVKIFSDNEMLSKPAIWVDGGTHAREWISISTTIYLIQRLVHDRFFDSSIGRMLQWFDWYIMPVVNPDGYEYTWKTDRLWRKNRSLKFSKECPGVDLNRNFETNFGAGNNFLNPCDEKFPGAYPFSEPETIAIQNATENLIGTKLRAFISLHSFDQVWMFADFRKVNQCLQETSQNIELTAIAATAAIQRVSGVKYRYGSVQHFVGNVGGASIEWVFHRLGVAHSFAVELPDEGKYGFNLPERLIIPTAKGILSALYAVAERIVKIGNRANNHMAICLKNASSSIRPDTITVYHNVINEIRKYFSI